MAAPAAAAGAARGPQVVLVSAGLLGFLVVIVLGGLMGGLASVRSLSAVGASASSPAISDIPTDYLVLYQQAAAAYGVDWAVLAAIGKLECDHGRSQARGCNPPGSVNGAGATGPMQFLGPTWRSGTPLGNCARHRSADRLDQQRLRHGWRR